MSEELTPQARALLDVSDAPLELPPDVRERVRERLAASLSTSAGGTRGAAARPKRSAAPREAAIVEAEPATSRARPWAIGAVLAAAALLLLWQGAATFRALTGDEADPAAASHVRDDAGRHGGVATPARGGQAAEQGHVPAGSDRPARERVGAAAQSAATEPPGTEIGAESEPTKAEEPSSKAGPDEPAAAAATAPRRPASKPNPAGRDRNPERDDARATEVPAVRSLSDELRSLESIQASLRAGRATAALRAISEHQRHFPNGSMGQELEALEIIARCKAGQHARGRRDAAAFLDAHPGSALAGRVTAACPEEAP